MLMECYTLQRCREHSTYDCVVIHEQIFLCDGCIHVFVRVQESIVLIDVQRLPSRWELCLHNPINERMQPSVSGCYSLDWLRDKRGSFSPCCISRVCPSLIGLVGCHCHKCVCVLVLLNLQILHSKSDILLLKIFYLLGVSLIRGVHLSLQGNDQRVIIKLLTQVTYHVF